MNVYFKKEGLNTLGEDGNTSYMVKLMITIMGAFGEVENEIRAERHKRKRVRGGFETTTCCEFNGVC